MFSKGNMNKDPHLTSLTQKHLKSKLKYEMESGIFTWRVSKSPTAMEGSTAGGLKPDGYMAVGIFINGKTRKYLTHRLAWLYVYGEFPKNQIDHIDHNRRNNAICNLRDVSGSENLRNQSLNSNNKSGTIGVSWNTQRAKWESRIYIDGTRKNLGLYDDIDDAIFMRREAEAHYGFHANHGNKAVKSLMAIESNQVRQMIGR